MPTPWRPEVGRGLIVTCTDAGMIIARPEDLEQGLLSNMPGLRVPVPDTEPEGGDDGNWIYAVEVQGEVEVKTEPEDRTTPDFNPCLGTEMVTFEAIRDGNHDNEASDNDDNCRRQ